MSDPIQPQQRHAHLKQAQAEFQLAPTDVRREVLDRVAPWYLFPQTQGRPRVIGLWGMTGTGKTHFVRQLVEALALQDSTIWLDVGAASTGMNFGNSNNLLDMIGDRFDGKPYVLVLDEFQHGCSLRHGNERPTNVNMRVLWELLDSGRVAKRSVASHLAKLIDLRDGFKWAIEHGMRVEKGVVVAGVGAWKSANRSRQMSWEDDALEDDLMMEKPLVFPRGYLNWLREVIGGPVVSFHAFHEIVKALDTDGVMELIDRMIANCSVPHVVDGSQGLIFVLGNLDELYVMGESPMAELHADVLQARHKGFGLHELQEALRNIFRIEQVARLGRDQFVFPPLSTTDQRRMLEPHATALAQRIGGGIGISVQVEGSLLDHIVQHHGIAVLGMRPLVNMLEQAVPDLVLRAQHHALEQQNELYQVALGVDAGKVKLVLVTSNGEEQQLISWPYVETEGWPSEQDVRRHAVHEAAHAIVGMAITKARPLQVCARTRSGSTRGFVVWDKGQETLPTRADLIPQMAMLLAGWVAERIWYGAEGVSMGSSSDIMRATRMAVDAIKERGMGHRPARYVQHQGSMGDDLRIELEACDQLAAEWVDAAARRAEEVMQAERPLWEALVEALCERHSLVERDVLELVGQHGGAYLRPVGAQVRPLRRRSIARRLLARAAVFLPGWLG
jgi:hypothetical protein